MYIYIHIQVRYLYIPLGGKRSQWWSIWLVFSFVGLWHDLEWRWQVCVCVCVYVCVYACTCAFTYLSTVSMHVCVYACICVFMYPSTSGTTLDGGSRCACVYVCLCVYTCTWLPVYLRIYVLCVCVCVSMHANVYVCTCVLVY